jgi:hypothetical protein
MFSRDLLLFYFSNKRVIFKRLCFTQSKGNDAQTKMMQLMILNSTFFNNSHPFLNGYRDRRVLKP